MTDTAWSILILVIGVLTAIGGGRYAITHKGE